MLAGSFTFEYTETVEGEYIKKIQTCNAQCKAWENEDQYAVVTLGKGEGKDYLQIGVCLQNISATEENGYCISIDLDEEFISNYTTNKLPQGELGTCKVAIWGAVNVERIYKEVEGIIYYTKSSGLQNFTSEESNRVFYGLGGLPRDIKTIGLAEPFTLTFLFPLTDFY